MRVFNRLSKFLPMSKSTQTMFWNMYILLSIRTNSWKSPKNIPILCVKELWVELMLVYMPFKRYMIFSCGMKGALPQSVICPIVKYNGSSRSYPLLHKKRTTLWYGSMTPGCTDYIYTLDSWLAILNFFINAYQQVLWALTLFNKTRRWVYWSGNKHHYTLKYLIDHQEKQQILHYSAKIPQIHRSWSKSDCKLYNEI